MNELREEYLGDGLFASFDGWLVVLRAPRAGGDHWVALEPAVLHEFKQYIERLQDQASKGLGESDAPARRE